MKILHTTLFVASIFAAIACTKFISQPVLVVKDCTGVYIRKGKNDYRVCNEKMLASFSNGQSIMVQYKLVNDCHPDGNRCSMFHQNDGCVEINSISDQ